MHNTGTRRHPILRVLTIISIVLLVLIGGTWAAFTWSPWPSALVVRSMFDKEGVRMNDALADRIDPALLRETLDIPYGTDSDALLDVFRPVDRGTQPLPTVVWIHGGAWISGDKGQIANYLRLIAAEGFTVVGLNYSIAPGATYPTPVRQTMSALEYLDAHAAELGVDPENIVLAGDSAGSQIAAQLANIITSPEYEQAVGIDAALRPAQLRSMVLACGAYDLDLVGGEGPFDSFLKTVLWSYTGTKNYLEDPNTVTASVLNYVTPDFPASFITAGNGDGLLPHSEALASRLNELGVPVDALFFEPDREPELPHEYQFALGDEAADEAFARIIAFLKAQTTP